MQSRYRNACSHVAIGLSEEGVRLESSLAAAANISVEGFCHFLSGPVLSMHGCVVELIAAERASIKERSLTVVHILHKLANELHNISFNQSVLCDALLNVGRFISPCDVHFFPRIDAASDGHFLAVPTSREL